MILQTRVLVKWLKNRYNSAFPDYPPLVISGRWLYGVWMIGNDYRNKTSFYGAYPPGLLKRYKAMFGDSGTILHIFSGSLLKGNYLRLDSNMMLDTDIYASAEYLPFESDTFNVVFADPPYSKEDALKYGCKMPNRFKVVKECSRCLKWGGLLVWLDTTFPMFRKSELDLIGTIGLIRSTNHKVRFVFIFRRM
jgi:hypothetical protein